MKKESKEIDFDFGFSFIDEEIEAIKETNKKLDGDYTSTAETARDLEKRLERLFQSIEPFLDNLCKDPEKSTIYWPNRVEKIQNYKKKLKSIAEGTAE